MKESFRVLSKPEKELPSFFNVKEDFFAKLSPSKQQTQLFFWANVTGILERINSLHI